MVMYRPGTYVEIIHVDMNSLQGRDPHPPLQAAGKMGQICGPAIVEDYDPDDLLILFPVYVPGLGVFEFAIDELN
jgi:hypothetical protein